MAVLSILRRPLQQICKPGSFRLNGNGIQLRNHVEKRTMPIVPSRFAYHKFKDYFHFYIMLGVLPLGALVFYVNMFIGPAQLAPIPEGYHPEKWEFYQHPISRWMAKNFFESHQEEYERFMQLMYEEHEKKEMGKIENKVRRLITERGDSHALYYGAPRTSHLQRVRDEYKDQREYTTADMET